MQETCDVEFMLGDNLSKHISLASRISHSRNTTVGIITERYKKVKKPHKPTPKTFKQNIQAKIVTSWFAIWFPAPVYCV